MGNVTAADGRVLASAGETCKDFSPDELASALRNGYIEPTKGKG